MTAHSPGPWRVATGEPRRIEDSAGSLVVTVDTLWGEDRAEADARLIAAAPRLVAMVRALVDGVAGAETTARDLLARIDGKEWTR